MQRAIIQHGKCKNCTDCLVIRNCEFRAIIKETPEDIPFVDFYKCSGCLKCKTTCRGKAIESVAQPCTGKPKFGW